MLQDVVALWSDIPAEPAPGYVQPMPSVRLSCMSEHAESYARLAKLRSQMHPRGDKLSLPQALAVLWASGLNPRLAASRTAAIDIIVSDAYYI